MRYIIAVAALEEASSDTKRYNDMYACPGGWDKTNSSVNNTDFTSPVKHVTKRQVVSFSLCCVLHVLVIHDVVLQPVYCCWFILCFISSVLFLLVSSSAYFLSLSFDITVISSASVVVAVAVLPFLHHGHHCWYQFALFVAKFGNRGGFDVCLDMANTLLDADGKASYLCVSQLECLEPFECLEC